MAQIPRAYIDGYVEGMANLDSYMKGLLSEALGRVDWDRPVAEVRDQLITIMRPFTYQARGTAAQLAAEFYDGLRELQVGERLGAVAMDGYSDHEVERAVRAAVTPLAEVDGWEEAERRIVEEAEARTAAALAECIGRSVREAGGTTLYGNGERDPLRPRFARVPRGSKSYPDGCPFCRMLASRGFVYRSKESAGATDPDHYHDGCSCAVVPAWGRGSVEGYNPDDYLDGYADYMAQDHSEHERNVRATQRNRYDQYGRLKSGTGERVDRKHRLTDDDRARIRRGRSLEATETRRRNRDRRWLENVGVYEDEWRAMSEAQQQALLDQMVASRPQALPEALSSLTDAKYEAMLSEGRGGLLDKLIRGPSTAVRARAETVRDELAKKRAFGPEAGKKAADYLRISRCTPGMERAVEEAVEYLPLDWLDVLRTNGVAVRGVVTSDWRPFFDPDSNTVCIQLTDDFMAIIHELVHAVEHNSNDVFGEVSAYFLSRTQGRNVEKLSTLTGSARYRSTERAYDMEGECIDPYAFKVYGNPDLRVFTMFEVATTGVEYLYRDIDAYERDFDMYSFIYHLITSV